MIVHRAYCFALDPTERQRRALASHLGAARFAYNWALEQVRTALAVRELELCCFGAVRTELPGWGLYALRREWNAEKETQAPWWRHNGAELVVADRFFASSRSCSRCGQVRAALTLKERVFRCPACGLTLDRDLNAAINLAGWAHPDVAGSAPETGNACGGDVSPGSRPAAPGEAGTGTAPEPAGMTGGRALRPGLPPAP